MTTIANWGGLLIAITILVVVVGVIGSMDGQEPRKQKQTHKPKKKDKGYHIMSGVLGVLVVVIITVAVGKAVMDSTQDCFKDIETKYPTAQCGFGESMYCEYQNKTYKVLQSWSEQNGTNCYFEGLA